MVDIGEVIWWIDDYRIWWMLCKQQQGINIWCYRASENYILLGNRNYFIQTCFVCSWAWTSLCWNPTVYGMAWTSVTLCECDHELADVVEFEPPVATNADSTHVHHWFRKLAAAHLIFNFHFIPCNFKTKIREHN